MFFLAKLEPNVTLTTFEMTCVFIFVFIIFYIYSHFLAGNLVPDKMSPILKLVSHYARKHFEIDHLLSL
jgi:quinol-cytochrome oxidoreductase complex cytochrome b subunit